MTRLCEYPSMLWPDTLRYQLRVHPDGIYCHSIVEATPGVWSGAEVTGPLSRERVALSYDLARRSGRVFVEPREAAS